MPIYKLTSPQKNWAGVPLYIMIFRSPPTLFTQANIVGEETEGGGAGYFGPMKLPQSTNSSYLDSKDSQSNILPFTFAFPIIFCPILTS